MTTSEDILGQLTAPGQIFEMTREVVDGHSVRNFVNREPSIGSLVYSASNHGDKEFLIQGDRRVSYAEFIRLVAAAAAGLGEQGLGKGDRIAILGHNSIDYVVTVMAAASMGGVCVALNGWWVGDELAYALADSDSTFLVCDSALWPRIKDHVEDSPVGAVLHMGKGTKPEGMVASDIWMNCDSSSAIPGGDDVVETDAFVILYTSGTTGRPKGCITTHGGTITQVMAILLNAFAASKAGGPSVLPTDGSQATALLTSPLFHVAGIHTGICTAMAVGARVVLHEGSLTPENIMSLIEKEAVTTWSGVPTLLHRVVHSDSIGNYELSSLQGISFGGAPSSPTAAAKAQEVLPVAPTLTNGYGMTETHGIIMLNGGADFDLHPTSIGHPVAIFDAKIIDEDGSELGDNQRGELLVSGPTVTPGYWNRPEENAATFRDGWLRTGDIAYRDDEGRYFIVDRGKDVIIRGGENVYCGEVESRILDHPAVDEAAVVGVPHPELGEQVKAVIYAPGGIDTIELAEFVGQTLARFKVPEIIEVSPNPLPRNPADKVIKSVLRGTGTGVFDETLMEHP